MQKPSRLLIELPHWAAAVRLFDDGGRLMPDVPVLRKNASGQYEGEMQVPPGIYDIEVNFLGKTVREAVSIPRGKVKSWTPADDATLAVPSAITAVRAPIEGMARERKTGGKANEGKSRLLLSIRFVDQEGKPGLPRPMRLFDARGSLVTDFTKEAVRDPVAGSVACSSHLPVGFYVLKSEMSDGGHWCRPVYLAAGWDTQLAISVDRSPGGSRLVSLRLHRSSTTSQDSASDVAAFALLDALARGTDASFITRDHVNAITKRKRVNPWLAVLMSYALLPLVESPQVPERRQAKDDPSSLLVELRNFLDNELPDHPDVRAIQLDPKRSAAPFEYPPLLLAGIKRVWAHSLKWKGTIPPDSLTERLIDETTFGAPWTTWVERDAAVPEAVESGVAVRYPEFLDSAVHYPGLLDSIAINPVSSDSAISDSMTSDPIAFGSATANVGMQVNWPRIERPSFLETLDAKSPVFRIRRPTTSRGSFGAIEMLHDSQIIDFVGKQVYEHPGALAASQLHVDTSGELRELLSIDPPTASQATGMPIDRVERVLTVLREQSSMTSAPTASPPVSLGDAERRLLEFAICDGKLAPGDTRSATAITLEEVMAELRASAEEAACPPAGEYDEELLRGINDVHQRLLERASLIALVDAEGSIIYCNGAFLAFLEPRAEDREIAVSRPVSCASQQRWEELLRGAITGESTLAGVGGSDDSTQWHLQRLPVTDSTGESRIAFANVMTVVGAPTIDEATIADAAALVHRLSLATSVYVHGSDSGRAPHGQNALQALRELEVLLSVRTEGRADDLSLSIGRHERIAGAAERLVSAQTLAAIQRIVRPLGEGIGLVDLAAWADQIKRRKAAPTDDPDTSDFLNDSRNAKHDTWHYVNIPAKAKAYDRAKLPEFTRDDDVVQMLGHAIKVLQKKSNRFSELNALRLVVHLVGDVHQPVHVGCSYLHIPDNKPPRMVLDPAVAKAKKLSDDHGGNLILLPIGTKGTALHSYWDSRLGGNTQLDVQSSDAAMDASSDPPDRSAVSADIDHLLALIHAGRSVADDTSTEAARPADSPELWPIAWADESLAAARSAYQDLVVARVEGTTTKRFFVEFSGGREEYDARNGPILVGRVKSAAKNLAALLDAILT